MATEDQPQGTDVNTGGVVRPVYSERQMRCLVVTESELKQIGLANLGVTVFTAIGTALLSFSFDIAKDTALSPPSVAATAQMAQNIDRFTFYGGIVALLIAASVWFWRHDMIKTIKQESKTG